MTISLVIPTYNASKGLGILLETTGQILEQAKYSEYEVILVDDGSEEEHRHFIRSTLMQNHPRLRILFLQGNHGQQLATITGIAHARGEIILTMDDDMEHPPRLLPELIQSIQEGNDLTYVISDILYASCVRKAGARFRDMVFRRMLRVPAGIRVSSFRAMNRTLAEAVLAGPCPWPYFSAMAVRQNPRIANIHTESTPRTQGRQRLLPLSGLLVKILLYYSLPGAGNAPPVSLPPHTLIPPTQLKENLQ